VTSHSKNWHGAEVVKDTTKKPFSDGIKKLVKCWNWCIEVEEDYVEK
jgi:hypothetical protein